MGFKAAIRQQLESDQQKLKLTLSSQELGARYPGKGKAIVTAKVQEVSLALI